MTQTVIEFDNVCFTYETEEVLHHVNLRIADRNLVAVVGPNGGGKSTLLRLILGFLHPRRGSVRVFGVEPARVRHRIGYVPQHLQFDPAFPVTVQDVVLMGRIGRRTLGAFRRNDRKAAMTALERVSMAPFARRSFANLSGGERQRVLIAQALVSDPDLLLMDEPTASVDSMVEHKIYDLIKELNETMTIVVVSHNLSVVTRHATHVACVNRTVSIMPLKDLEAAKLAAVHAGDMTVLQHEMSCQIIDPTESLQTPHGPKPAGDGA